MNKVGAPEPAPAAAPPVGLPLARPASFAPASARLGAFAADTALLAALLAAHVAAARLCGAAYILDLVRNTLPAWCVLAALLSVAYGFFFSLAGRTPGMALAGIRLEPLRPASPRRALLRALLALPSAALGCFGFVLALFDARSQTLHDKLCGFVAVTD